MAHPFEDTIDLQADIAWDRLHPISEQSVPIPATFGLSHQLRVTLQLFGVMTASVVVPSDSPAVVSFGDADGASGFPGFETSFCDVGESTPQAHRKAADTEMQNTPIARSIC